MPVTTTVTPGRNRSSVTVDVSGGEYLAYEVCIVGAGGAQNDAILVSLHRDDLDDIDGKKNVILDEDQEVSAACRAVDWPDESAWVGLYAHTLVLTFARAVEYRYRVKLMDDNGNVKTWVKDCRYKRSSQEDVKRVRLMVRVK